MKNLFYLSFLFAFTACGQTTSSTLQLSQNETINTSTEGDSTKITTNAYWKDSLTAQEYRILREHGTESAFTGEYWDYKGTGTFVCGACKLPLFESNTKFKSGTGWPSFFRQIGYNVETQSDNTLGMSRNEIHCTRCKGHLGHIFNDGPEPTGLRYCVNSASIKLKKPE
ncbi:MAG: peptide-methionine (R)-S-oxide reductase MsrB [Flavobacteriales bacterium]|nr:peptide-methionine (R)-S-oxide reductase MsrB [Flavobacteriales bacterium]